MDGRLAMGEACCVEDLDAVCGEAQDGEGVDVPYFAALGAEALGFYPPAELLQALLQHRGAGLNVRAEPMVGTRGPDGTRAASPDPLPSGASRARSRGVGAAQQAFDVEGRAAFVAALSCQLLDALLVGLDLVLPDVELMGRKGPVIVPVPGGRAVFVRSATEAPYVVWAAATKTSVCTFCSCGTASKDENVGARVRSSKSSTCMHAEAYSQALQQAVKHFLCSTTRALLRLYPAIDNFSVNALHVDTFMMQPLPDGAAIHVVGYNHIWCIVHTPGARTRKTRPVCQHVPCRTRNSRCLHSFAVKPPIGGYGGFNNPAKEGAENKGDDDGGAASENSDQNGGAEGEARTAPPPAASTAPRRRRPAAHAAKKKGQERVYLDTDYRRRARNLLPCASETRVCLVWDGVARGTPLPADVGEDLYESKCHKCGTAAGVRGPAVLGDLYTLSGPTKIRTRQWLCPDKECAEIVRFDGSDYGLFAYNAETIYTRTLLDVILFTVISTKSSISAATAVSAFNLHCSGAVHANDSTQTRQELSYATDQYSRTLIVPRSLYRCVDCYHCSETPYAAVVADGQTIGIFREASFPFEKDTINVPTIPISINDACAAFDPKVRLCVRQRLKAGYSAEVTFNKAEQKALSTFASLSDVAPALGVHTDAEHRKKAGSWAASIFWCSFFATTAEAQGGNDDEELTDASRSPPGSPPPPKALLSPSVPPPAINNTSSTFKPTLRGGGVADDANGAVQSTAGFRFCKVIPEAIGGDDVLPIVRRERWCILFDFFSTFVAEPVIGIFSGCNVDELTELSQALIDGKKQEQWNENTTGIQSLHVVWPALDLLADSMDDDVELSRAMGELILFAVHTDLHMEALWRCRMNAEALRFEADWTDTDAAKFKEWQLRQPAPAEPRLPSGLVSKAASAGRADDQAAEIRSGVVMPDLDQVRPHPTDNVAAAAARAARDKEKQTNPTKKTKRKRADMENGGLGDDDCRHAFITHNVFTPGVVSYLCPCGVLIGFEVLETAESPAGIVAALAARFPRLPKTVYFDTACQSSRNATRRMPWLVRLSETSWALDRFHAVAHKCSPLFDANNYPERSGLHKTSAAENRHSLNKPLKSHLTYLGQDRFVVQMRLIGAINNLLILYRRTIGKSDVRHRPLPSFFHSHLVSQCERVVCACRQ